MLPIVNTLEFQGIRLELLNTLNPEKIEEYAERSTVWINDPEIHQYLGRQGTTLELSTDWYHNLRSKIRTDRTFAIWFDNKHVGNCGIHQIGHGTGYIGIMIGQAVHHSRGIGTCSMHAMCNHAFVDLGLRKLWLHVIGHNTRGIRCYEKVGFSRVGCKKQHHMRKGIWRDEITMEIMACEYVSTKI